jgi:hypothetical protein
LILWDSPPVARYRWRRAHLLAVLCPLAILSGPAAVDGFAADRPKLATLNVVVQAAVTTVSAAVQGHIHKPGDIVRCLASGSASGLGIYEAKALAGAGNVSAGWVLANVTGSFSENAAAGRHPLAQVGYSFGPLRVRVSMPRFDRESDAHAYVDVSAFETLALVAAIHDSDHILFRGGMIAFRRDSPLDAGPGAIGSAYGIFPSVFLEFGHTWAHESVHAVQSLQTDVLEPSFGFLKRDVVRRAGQRKAALRFGRVNPGLLNLTNRLVVSSQPYEQRWVEIEAYRLGQDTVPQPLRWAP